jgi:hypothetical protein
MNNLKQQQSLNHDQYSKTIADASNVQKGYRFDNLGRKIGEKNKYIEENSKSKDDNSELSELSFVQKEGRCYCFGKAGHKSPKFTNKNKTREEWYTIRLQRAEGSSTCKYFSIG